MKIGKCGCCGKPIRYEMVEVVEGYPKVPHGFCYNPECESYGWADNDVLKSKLVTIKYNHGIAQRKILENEASKQRLQFKNSVQGSSPCLSS